MTNKKIRKKIIAIIPARGGSKGIPGKNLKMLCGKPLLSYPILLAKSIKMIDRIIVSSEDKKILSCARRFGAEVPFTRPKKLARDATPTLPVLQHCVKYLEKKQDYHADYIIVLYPTCPLLKKKDVMSALRKLLKSKEGCVISVEKDYGKFWDYTNGRTRLLHPKKRVNRQWQKPIYRENGAIYAMSYETLIKKNMLVDPKTADLVVMEQGSVIDIDTPEDLKEVQRIFRKQK